MDKKESSVSTRFELS